MLVFTFYTYDGLGWGFLNLTRLNWIEKITQSNPYTPTNEEIYNNFPQLFDLLLLTQLLFFFKCQMVVA